MSLRVAIKRAQLPSLTVLCMALVTAALAALDRS